MAWGCLNRYHDNTLSRCPGSQRTKWHCDDGPDKHMAMATPNVRTLSFTQFIISICMYLR